MDKIAAIKKKWLENQIVQLKNSGMSKAEIARKLEIKPQQLNNIVSGVRGVSDNFIDKFIDIFKINQIDLFANIGDGSDRREIPLPLIPSEAFAGYGAVVYGDLPIEDYYTVNEFRDADFLIRVKGDSMSPKFNGGDIVACKKIKEMTFFQWNRIYVIYTESQGILIKRVMPSDDDSSITLVSDNKAYQPFNVPKSEISAIALVLGAIILE
jgi:SOS-response transcriptional repressor LexA